MNLLEAAKLALSDLKDLHANHGITCASSMAALRTAIEDAEKCEPAVWMQSNHARKFMQKAYGSDSMLARCSSRKLMSDYVPLYTHPALETEP
jgi:hypothetical protein